MQREIIEELEVKKHIMVQTERDDQLHQVADSYIDSIKIF